jgi:hypothetical protein
VTADGRFYVIAAQDLNLISTDTLSTTTVAVAPFEIRTLVPQPDPDLMLLIGDNPGIDRNSGMRYYVYSISRQTFAQPDAAYRNQGRIVYLANIHKLGFVSQNRVTLLDSLPVEEAMSHEDFVGLMTREQDQHRTAMAQESRGPHISGTGPVRVETIPGARVTMLTSGSKWTVSSSPAGSAASDSASIEGIGIEQTSNYVTKPDGSKQGVAIVHVKRGSGAPVSLVLSSHEAVRWMITIERGAVIKSIMTAGPNPAQVIGIGIGSRHSHHRCGGKSNGHGRVRTPAGPGRACHGRPDSPLPGRSRWRGVYRRRPLSPAARKNLGCSRNLDVEHPAGGTNRFAGAVIGR